VTDQTAAQQTIDYYLQTRQPDGSWTDSSSRMDDLEWARDRLATRRQTMPQWEHRIAWRATSVAMGVLDADEGAAPAGVAPATDRATLVEIAAQAIWARYTDAEPSRTGLVMANPHAAADAVLSVLPTTTDRATEATPVVASDAAANGTGAPVGASDRAAVLREAAEALGRMDYDTDSNDYGYDTYRDAWNGGVMDGAEELRRMAAEAGPADVAGRTGDETAGEAPQPDVTVHAIPVPGSNGISSCCGRPPCEFVGERVTRDPDEVTCPGPAGGAPQPKETRP
jgi:hypothetical protein